MSTHEPLRVDASRPHYCTHRQELRMRGYRDNPNPGDDPSWLTRKDEVPDPCVMCLAARRRRDNIERGCMLPFYVVAYVVDRCYGGPEEGGWWYDRLSILEVRRAWDLSTGLKAARELREAHPTCRHGRESVLGSGDVYVRCYYETNMLPEETKGKPRYE